MEVHYRSDGIFLPEIGLWLDPRHSVETAWLSHAHSDHARGHHASAIATVETLALYRDRWPDDERPRRMIPLSPGQRLPMRGAMLQPLRAAHILGSAQLLIEFRGERLLYTGDIKLRRPLLGWTTERCRCDRLIVESTFGLPVFHFLEADEARDRIVRFASECLAQQETPAFFGYPLGRGQEIVWVLANAGIPVAVHGAIARYIPYYESAGFHFPAWEPYDARSCTGKALVVTPGLRANLEASLRKVRTAYVSGWAMFDSARTRSGADELIPYSDHGDYTELLALVEASGARRVDIVHGYAEALATVLRAKGIDAHAVNTMGSGAASDEAEG